MNVRSTDEPETDARNEHTQKPYSVKYPWKTVADQYAYKEKADGIAGDVIKVAVKEWKKQHSVPLGSAPGE